MYRIPPHGEENVFRRAPSLRASIRLRFPLLRDKSERAGTAGRPTEY
ncbi:MAG: hypothetical protein LBP64_02700 [Tannerella sp.]|jgi:hypothetical protein|nr:hypothetical protein [Tannerella sp.]